MVKFYIKIYILVYLVGFSSSVSAQLNLTRDYYYNGESDIVAGRSIVLIDGFHIDGGNQAKMHIDINTQPYPSEFSIEDVAYGFDESNDGFLALVGAISGQQGVSSSGAATYTIPIKLPKGKGANNMQPSLSLVYNSQSGNGLVGYGWNMGGMSMISRAPKSVYYNGSTAPVTSRATDVFLLDGQRMFAISGDNGADGTVYGVENENYSEIISHGQDDEDCPQYFTVKTKDGTQYTYGGFENSSFGATSTLRTNMVYMLCYVKDPAGNTIIFHYSQSSTDRWIVLSYILYGANETNQGEHPTTKVEFEYMTKSNTLDNKKYQGGISIRNPFVLNKINVRDYGSNNIFTSYHLSYTVNHKEYFLTSISQTGTDGATLPATIFGYGTSESIPDMKLFGPTSLSENSQTFQFGDFDGDGRSDALGTTYKYDNNGVRYNTRYDVYSDFDQNQNSATLLYSESLPEGEKVEIQKTKINNAFYDLMPSDFNGDGAEDILKIKKQFVQFSGYNPLQKVNGATLTSIIQSKESPGSAPAIHSVDYPVPVDLYGRTFRYFLPDKTFFIPGDFDGDGNMDYILLLGQFVTPEVPSSGIYFKAFLTSPANNNVNEEIVGFNLLGDASYAATDIAYSDNITALDVNGDGKLELMITKDNKSYIISINGLPLSTGYRYKATIMGTTNKVKKDNTVLVGDFNCDRISDLLVRNIDGKSNRYTPWKIYLGNADISTADFYGLDSVDYIFPRPVWLDGDNNYSYSNDIRDIRIVDFNGDGQTDVVSYYQKDITAPVVVAGQTYSNTTITETMVASLAGNSISYAYINTPPMLSTSMQGIVDMDGDGKNDFFYKYLTFGNYVLYFRPFGMDKLLTSVANEYGYQVLFNYKSLADYRDPGVDYFFYKRTDPTASDPSLVYPYNNLRPALFVVKSLSVPNGIGGYNTESYSYQDGIFHGLGKGFLGFKKITSNDLSRDMTTIAENTINTQYAVALPLKNSVSLTSTGSLLSQELFTNNIVSKSTNGYWDKRFEIQQAKAVSIDYMTGASSESTNIYDNFGNITSTTTKKGVWDGASVAAVETQTPNITYIQKGQATSPVFPYTILTKSTRTGQPEVTVQNTFFEEWDDARGYPISKVDFDGSTNMVSTSYTYDIYGNVIETTVSASGLNPRKIKNTYDWTGRFIIKKETMGSGITKTETYTYDDFGQQLSATSSDGLTTGYAYDGFGRLEKTELPDGQVMLTALCQVFGNGFIKYTYAANGGVPDVRTVYDKLGREIAKETSGFGGQKLLQTTAYNAKGQTVSTVAPH